MSQESASPPHYHSAELSQSESLAPLSPILGSGQSIRKFRKNRKRLKKQPKESSQNIVEPEETSLRDDSNLQVHESIICRNEPSTVGPESVLDQIKTLEALELRKFNIAKSISLNACVEPDISLGLNTSNEQSTIVSKIDETNNVVSNIVTRTSTPIGPLGFKTGAGKSIDISNSNVETSRKLFEDILCPSSSRTSRENKRNYLHKELCLENPQRITPESSTLMKEKQLLDLDKHEEQKEKVKAKEDKVLDHLAYSRRFKTASTNVKDVNCYSGLQKLSNNSQRNVFEGENFNDLNINFNHIGFKPASVNLGEMKKHLGDSETVSKNVVISKSIIATNNVTKSVFEGESFNDLNTNYNKGASVSLGQVNKHLSDLKTSNKNVVISKSISATNNATKSVFEGENLDDLPSLVKAIGFKPASMSLGKAKFEQANFRSPKMPLKNIFEAENFDDLNLKQIPGFRAALLNDIAPHKMSERKQKGFCDNHQSLDQCKTALKRPRNIFEGENFDDLNLIGLNPTKPNVLHTKRSGGFQCPFSTPIKNTDVQDKDDFRGFSRGEQQIALNISQDKSHISQILCEQFQLITKNHNSGLPLFAQSQIKGFSEHIQTNIQKCSLDYVNRKRKFSEVDSDHNSLCQSASTSSVTPLQTNFAKRTKKRLGCPFSPTIGISETGLKRAKLLFEDLEPKSIPTSTPIKIGGNLASPLACDLTPIPALKRNSGGSFSRANESGSSFTLRQKSWIDSTITAATNRFSLNKPSAVDVGVWLESLSHEKRLLEEQLRVVGEKQTILTNQRTILKFSGRDKKRIIPGVLYKSKNASSRVSLREFVNYTSPGINASDIALLNEINPQNAHLMHFYVCDRRESHIKTEDGAVIVPNTDSRIGISEIEHSFKLLDGVDPGLIPEGWIRNHFKWIVWKLASYERMFADKFDGCLSLENVVQQLKYRYDVEIDNVKRPILRKIFEKDDCSQRRIILCVSKIIKLHDFYELELTDGWYPIRTLIDPPLCDQIVKRKIKLGVKLIVYGAELMNCEGCHPLEAPGAVHLKISCNSTRRASWWSKLGCQKEAGPFLVPMSSIQMDGGKIGCIKCFVLRVYPVKYMEKCAGKKVWRNRKAEERREQEFYNQKFRGFASTTLPHNNINFKSRKDIESIHDPAVLYDVMQTSGDPEGLQEILSTSQRTMLYNYSINRPGQARQKAEICGRSVTPLLQIKVVDFSLVSDKVYDFHIWRPGEGHLQELKEGEIVTISNVSCSPKWGLSANQTTQFRRNAKPKDERFQKFRRKVTEIGELRRLFIQQPWLNEFDTVGLVVKKVVSYNSQQVWMSDSNQKLLFIKISESPKNILALDIINEGQIVSVCNLVLKHCYNTHCYAVAEHSVIFARYSQYKHLQDGLEKLEEDFMKVERAEFIEKCQHNINRIEAQSGLKNKLIMDADGMECSQITITDMALLECVEKLT